MSRFVRNRTRALAFSTLAGLVCWAGSPRAAVDPPGPPSDAAPVEPATTDALRSAPQPSLVSIDRGAVSLSRSLALPPGRGGMTPAVSLSYASGGVDSWVGRGFSLDAERIVRVGGTGRGRVPAYDGGDSFEVVRGDGSRARLVRLPDDGSGVVRYRPRRDEADAEYQRVGTTDRWIARTVEGRERHFVVSLGATGHRGPKSYETAAEWRLVRERDAEGNIVDYEYDVAGPTPVGRRARLRTVWYGGNDGAGNGKAALPHVFRVRFLREGQPGISPKEAESGATGAGCGSVRYTPNGYQRVPNDPGARPDYSLGGSIDNEDGDRELLRAVVVEAAWPGVTAVGWHSLSLDGNAEVPVRDRATRRVRSWKLSYDVDRLGCDSPWARHPQLERLEETVVDEGGSELTLPPVELEYAPWSREPVDLPIGPQRGVVLLDRSATGAPAVAGTLRCDERPGVAYYQAAGASATCVRLEEALPVSGCVVAAPAAAATGPVSREALRSLCAPIGAPEGVASSTHVDAEPFDAGVGYRSIGVTSASSVRDGSVGFRADFDGDGAADILHWQGGDGGPAPSTAIRVGDRVWWSGEGFSLGPVGSRAITWPLWVNTAGLPDAHPPVTYATEATIDLNGDGLLDVVSMRPVLGRSANPWTYGTPDDPFTQPFRFDGPAVLYNHGAGFDYAALRPDVLGRTIDDLGRVVSRPSDGSSRTVVILADYDGDGLRDLVGGTDSGTQQGWVRFNDGRGFRAATSMPFNVMAGEAGDHDLDGRLDVVVSGPDGKHLRTSSMAPGALVRVRDGAGRETQLAWTRPAVPHAGAPAWVVSSARTVVTSRPGEASIREFSYEAPAFRAVTAGERAGDAFLGFDRVVERPSYLAGGVVRPEPRVTAFYARSEETGDTQQLVRTDINTIEGALLSSTMTGYVTQRVDGVDGAVLRVLPRTNMVVECDPLSGYCLSRSRTVSYEMDAPQVKEIVDEGDLDDPTDDQVTTMTRARLEASPGRRSVVQSVIVRGANGSLVSHVAFEWDGMAVGVGPTGRLTRVRRLLSPGSGGGGTLDAPIVPTLENWLDTSIAYGAYGRPVRYDAPEGSTALCWDAFYFYPVQTRDLATGARSLSLTSYVTGETLASWGPTGLPSSKACPTVSSELSWANRVGPSALTRPSLPFTSVADFVDDSHYRLLAGPMTPVPDAVYGSPRPLPSTQHLSAMVLTATDLSLAIPTPGGPVVPPPAPASFSFPVSAQVARWSATGAVTRTRTASVRRDADGRFPVDVTAVSVMTGADVSRGRPFGSFEHRVLLDYAPEAVWSVVSGTVDSLGNRLTSSFVDPELGRTGTSSLAFTRGYPDTTTDVSAADDGSTIRTVVVARDVLGRATRIQQVDGTTGTVIRDSQVRTRILPGRDGSVRRIDRELDAAGAVLAQTERDAIGQTRALVAWPVRTGAPLVTTLGYGPARKVSVATHPDGTVTRWTHDLLGREQTVQRFASPVASVPLSSVTRSYDRFGKVALSSDGLGRMTQYLRDEAGRLVYVVVPPASEPTPGYGDVQVDYVTDPASPAFGAIARIASPWESTTFGFDEVGRPRSATRSVGVTIDGARLEDSFTRTFRYSDGGLQTGTTFDLGTEGILSISLQRDRNGRVSRIVDGDPATGRTLVSVSYGLRGQVRTRTDALGGVDQLGYDAAGAPTWVSVSTSLGGYLESLHRDLSGIPDRVTVSGGFSRSYDWTLQTDRLGRLTAAAGKDFQYRMTFDRLRPLTSFEQLGATAASTRRYNYRDEMGPSFDPAALSSVSEGGVPLLELGYDADGAVTSRARGAVNDGILLDPMSRIVATRTAIHLYDAQGNRTHTYDRATQTVRGMMDGLELTYARAGAAFSRQPATKRRVSGLRVSASGVESTHRDLEGNAAVVQTSTSLVRRMYGPYGHALETVGSFPAAFPIGPLGGEADSSGLDLVHVGARDWDPIAMRFTRRDPVLAGGGLRATVDDNDPYNLVRYNPYVFQDPTGLQTFTWYTQSGGNHVMVPPSSTAIGGADLYVDERGWSVGPGFSMPSAPALRTDAAAAFQSSFDAHAQAGYGDNGGVCGYVGAACTPRSEMPVEQSSRLQATVDAFNRSTSAFRAAVPTFSVPPGPTSAPTPAERARSAVATAGSAAALFGVGQELPALVVNEDGVVVADGLSRAQRRMISVCGSHPAGSPACSRAMSDVMFDTGAPQVVLGIGAAGLCLTNAPACAALASQAGRVVAIGGVFEMLTAPTPEDATMAIPDVVTLLPSLRLPGAVAHVLERNAVETVARVCTGPGCKCFGAGTPVLTDHGDVPIEQVGPGERVWGYDASSGEWGFHDVVAASERFAQEAEMVTIALDGETIVATSAHPFCVESGMNLHARPVPEDIGDDAPACARGGRWVAAGALSAGDVLGSATQSRVISEVMRSMDARRVYNLTVTGSHSYVVGRAHALVHNIPCPLLSGATVRSAESAFLEAQALGRRQTTVGATVVLDSRGTVVPFQTGPMPAMVRLGPGGTLIGEPGVRLVQDPTMLITSRGPTRAMEAVARDAVANGRPGMVVVLDGAEHAEVAGRSVLSRLGWSDASIMAVTDRNACLQCFEHFRLAHPEVILPFGLRGSAGGGFYTMPRGPLSASQWEEFFGHWDVFYRLVRRAVAPCERFFCLRRTIMKNHRRSVFVVAVLAAALVPASASGKDPGPALPQFDESAVRGEVATWTKGTREQRAKSLEAGLLSPTTDAGKAFRAEAARRGLDGKAIAAAVVALVRASDQKEMDQRAYALNELGGFRLFADLLDGRKETAPLAPVYRSLEERVAAFEPITQIDPSVLTTGMQPPLPPPGDFSFLAESGGDPAGDCASRILLALAGPALGPLAHALEPAITDVAAAAQTVGSATTLVETSRDFISTTLHPCLDLDKLERIVWLVVVPIAMVAPVVGGVVGATCPAGAGVALLGLELSSRSGGTPLEVACPLVAEATRISMQALISATAPTPIPPLPGFPVPLPPMPGGPCTTAGFGITMGSTAVLWGYRARMRAAFDPRVCPVGGGRSYPTPTCTATQSFPPPSPAVAACAAALHADFAPPDPTRDCRGNVRPICLDGSTDGPSTGGGAGACGDIAVREPCLPRPTATSMTSPSKVQPICGCTEAGQEGFFIGRPHLELEELQDEFSGGREWRVAPEFLSGRRVVMGRTAGDFSARDTLNQRSNEEGVQAGTEGLDANPPVRVILRPGATQPDVLGIVMETRGFTSGADHAIAQVGASVYLRQETGNCCPAPTRGLELVAHPIVVAPGFTASAYHDLLHHPQGALWEYNQTWLAYASVNVSTFVRSFREGDDDGVDTLCAIDAPAELDGSPRRNTFLNQSGTTLLERSSYDSRQWCLSTPRHNHDLADAGAGPTSLPPRLPDGASVLACNAAAVSDSTLACPRADLVRRADFDARGPGGEAVDVARARAPGETLLYHDVGRFPGSTEYCHAHDSTYVSNAPRRIHDGYADADTRFGYAASQRLVCFVPPAAAVSFQRIGSSAIAAICDPRFPGDALMFEVGVRTNLSNDDTTTGGYAAAFLPLECGPERLTGDGRRRRSCAIPDNGDVPALRYCDRCAADASGRLCRAPERGRQVGVDITDFSTH